jgi:hypothetical protein
VRAVQGWADRGRSQGSRAEAAARCRRQRGGRRSILPPGRVSSRAGQPPPAGGIGSEALGLRDAANGRSVGDRRQRPSGAGHDSPVARQRVDETGNLGASPADNAPGERCSGRGAPPAAGSFAPIAAVRGATTEPRGPGAKAASASRNRRGPSSQQPVRPAVSSPNSRTRVATEQATSIGWWY